MTEKQQTDLKRINQRIGYDPTTKTSAVKKVIEITIIQCQNLKRGDSKSNTDFNPKFMQPFFSFDFYTFEF